MMVSYLAAALCTSFLQSSPVADSFLGARAGSPRMVNGIELCWCPPGRFRMGSPESEPGRRPDEGQVDVTLTSGFWMGKYEVTQKQWLQIMGTFPTKRDVGEGDNFPVYGVSYIEAEEFCRKLTQRARKAKELPAGWEFRLPTEAQWEYSCRAGTSMAYSSGNTLTLSLATFGKPYNGTPTGMPGSAASVVGSFPANA